MSRTTRFALFAGAAFAVAGAAQAAVPTDPPYEYRPIPGASPEPIVEGAGLRGREDLEAFFDGVMSAHFKAQRIVGATVSVVKDGELYFSKGWGYGDLEKRVPVDPAQTLFRPGSITKLFTWTAVMQLVEQGKLDLDADVNRYLTQFQIPATFDQPITLRNLMTHTPGLEDGAVGYLFRRDPDGPPLAEALRAHMPARVRPPTTDFGDTRNASYSNWGTALAGLIVANVSGMGFNDYVKQNILDPLGMTRSTFEEPLPPELAPHMSGGYLFEQGRHRAGGFEYIEQFGPAGNLSTPAEDMAKFMIAHLQDGRYGDARILAPETAQYMHARRMSPNPYVNGSGLGFYEWSINGRRIIAHAGGTIYFHSDLWLLKREQLGIFVSYNTASVLPFAEQVDLLRTFMDRYYPSRLPVVKPPPDFKERAAEYAGTYRPNRHSYTKNERMVSLFGGMRVTPTADNTLLIGAPGAPTSAQFVEVAPDTFRQIDDYTLYSFHRNAAGEITHLNIGFAFISFYKVPFLESALLHGFIIGFGVLCFVVAIVGAVRHWKADRTAPAAARLGRRVAAATGLVHLVFLLLLVATFAGGIREMIFAWPATFKAAVVMPLLALPLTLGVLYFAWRIWREGAWTRYARVQYSVIAVMCVAFLLTLNFVNLVGFHFG